MTGGAEGRSQALIRSAGPGDAAALLRLKRRPDQETAFMLLEPGERRTSVQVLAGDLSAVARSGNSASSWRSPATSWPGTRS